LVRVLVPEWEWVRAWVQVPVREWVSELVFWSGFGRGFWSRFGGRIRCRFWSGFRCWSGSRFRCWFRSGSGFLSGFGFCWFVAPTPDAEVAHRKSACTTLHK
jgi:hypothetical protein